MSKFTMPNIKVPVFENCTKPFVNLSVVSVRERDLKNPVLYAKSSTSEA